jgi:hypothetical protein
MKKSKLFSALFILSLQGMIACRSDDILPQISSAPKQDFIQPHTRTRVLIDTPNMTSEGVFTFLNGQKAVIYFDKKGGITALNIDGDSNVSYEYDKAHELLEITKWGNVAQPNQDENQLGDYSYSKAPIIRWFAYLNTGWSGVQFLNKAEQANIEGIGKYELTHVSTLKPVIHPILPIRKDYSE